MTKKTDDDELSGIGDILKGFGKIINTVVNMAEKDIPLKRSSGDLFKDIGDKNRLKGIYDFSVKMGLDKEYSGVHEKDMLSQQKEPDIEIPQTDVLREQDRLIAILEMCGVGLENFRYRLDGNVLKLEGEGENRIYKKDIDLEGFITDEKLIHVSEKNSIFKVVINRKKNNE